MNKCEFNKEPYMAPQITSLLAAVEAGFSISNENGAGGGSFGGGFDEFEVKPETGDNWTGGSWSEGGEY